MTPVHLFALVFLVVYGLLALGIPLVVAWFRTSSFKAILVSTCAGYLSEMLVYVFGFILRGLLARLPGFVELFITAILLLTVLGAGGWVSWLVATRLGAEETQHSRHRDAGGRA
ncbi:MAG: hypothetical protein HY319_24900 [Armatimonadetes bacterium]|nr:hypothetical protein [Armatimonadota bacterium]